MKYEKDLASIISIIRKGEKSFNQFKIGIEFEHIIVNRYTFESISYCGEEGIEGIFHKLLLKEYEGTYEDDNLVELIGKDTNISLGAGGQLRVKIKKCKAIEDVKSIYFNFLKDIVPILEEKNLLLMAIGYHPKSLSKQIIVSPKKKYEYIEKYFSIYEEYIWNMIKGTASLKVYIDYNNEEDFIKKLRVANFISPFLNLISDNSPIFEGEIFTKFSLKNIVSDSINKEKNITVSNFFDRSIGYKDYAEYILSTPPILIKNKGKIIFTNNKTLEELMKEYVFSEEELSYAMAMIVSNIKIKDSIEIAVGDSLPYPYNFSYITLIKGIFYSDIALQYMYNLSQRIEDEKFNKIKSIIAEEGFSAKFKSRSTYECIRILFDLAKKSLTKEEKEMLMPLEGLIIKKNNLSTLLKQGLKEEGIHILKYCSLNQLAMEEKQNII